MPLSLPATIDNSVLAERNCINFGTEEKKILIKSILGKRGRKETEKKKRKQKKGGKKVCYYYMVPRWQQREKKSITSGRDSLLFLLLYRSTFYDPTCGNIRYILTFTKKGECFSTYFGPFIKRVALKKRFWYGNPPIKIKLFCHFRAQLLLVLGQKINQTKKKLSGKNAHGPAVGKLK